MTELDAALTSEEWELVALVRRYHPPVNSTRDDDEQAFLDSPQHRALRERAAQSQEILPAWRQFVRAVQTALPEHYVADGSRPHITSWSPTIVVGIAPGQDSLPDDLIVLRGSLLAPVYVVYESHKPVHPSPHNPRDIQYELAPESEAIAQVIENELHARFEWRRLSSRAARFPIPNIQTPTRGRDGVTLANALFDDYPW